MILLLDTSTPLCRVSFIDGDIETIADWQADRTLAKNLLTQLQESLGSMGKTLHDIDGIGVFEGPGSFTGLRIGMTVANTIADSQGVAIVGERGDDWRRAAISRLRSGENDRLVMPFYGSDAHITLPRK